MKLLRLLLVGLTLGTSVQAQTLTTPTPGSAARQAILNALRGPVGKRLGQPDIRFRVVDLQVSNTWAFVQARPMNSSSQYLFDPQSGAPEVWALLQKQGEAWKVVRWAIPTDVISETWAQELPSVPAKLWPHNRWQPEH